MTYILEFIFTIVLTIVGVFSFVWLIVAVPTFITDWMEEKKVGSSVYYLWFMVAVVIGIIIYRYVARV